MMTKKNNILAIENLSIGYRSKGNTTYIKSDLQTAIKSGTFIAVLGKNGIGKSTFLRTVSGLQEKLSGTISIDNKPLEDYSSLELSRKLSLVLTDRLPESQLTVFELVALGRQPYTNWLDKLTKEDKSKINDALKLTDTLHLKDSFYYELSDGQLQRVLIARALAQDTPLIILDEPTAHLDIHHTIKVLSLLKDLVDKTNKTILISTHQVNLALQLADELILLTEDEFYQGTTQELIQDKKVHQLFPKDYIIFDENVQQFIFNKK